MSKFFSRKFVITILSLVVISLICLLKLDNFSSVATILASVPVAYIAGNSYVAKNKGDKK